MAAKPKPMKIFELHHPTPDVYDWIAAETNVAALQVHMLESELMPGDFDGNEIIIEIPEDQWEDYGVFSKENKPINFTQWMKENPEGGYIASTVFTHPRIR